MRELRIDYTNYKGEREVRRIVPNHLWFGINKWHTGAQWFICAQAADRNMEHRMFAMNSIHAIIPPDQWEKPDGQ